MNTEYHQRIPTKIEPCRLCKKLMPRSGIFAHAHAAHKAVFFDYLNGHGYGFAEWDVLEAHKVTKRL